ncbi:MAG: hypothetical protein ACXWBP_08675 [Limisphaerales bacterium]
MQASDFFTTDRLKQMREEICEQGFVADNFLADNPDAPVFGVNLACLYPFPPAVRQAYETLAARLGAIDPSIYVYPTWETHVTIATFINFSRHRSPTPARLAELKTVMQRVAIALEPAFLADTKPFDLWIEPPVISRKAAILPLSDPAGSIVRLRTRVAEILDRIPTLKLQLHELGLNIPPIVHSTIMRFKTAPPDTQRLLSKFDEISRAVPRIPMRVSELYVTTETKPYMRAGEIIHRFQL